MLDPIRTRLPVSAAELPSLWQYALIRKELWVIEGSHIRETTSRAQRGDHIGTLPCREHIRSGRVAVGFQ